MPAARTAVSASALLIAMLLIASVLTAAANVDATLEWSKTYPRPPQTTPDNIPITHTDGGVCFTQTADGGYFIVGTQRDYFYRGPHSSGDESYKGVLMKTNSSGEVEWQREISPSISLNAQDAYQTADRDYVVVASYYVFKFDQQGQLERNVSLGAQISAAQQTSGGYVLVCKNQDFSFIGTDKEFNVQWNKSLSFVPHDGYMALADASGGGHILVGYTHNCPNIAGVNQPNLWIIKTEANGDIQFTKSYNFYDQLSIKQTNPVLLDNAFVISTGDGYFLAGTAEFRDDHFNSPFIVKLDSDGNWLWSRTYASSPRDNSFVHTAVKTPDGGLFIVGSYASQPIGWHSNTYDVSLVFKVNVVGDVVINQTFSSVEDYHCGSASAVCVTDDGGYAVLGSLDDAVWLAKFTTDTANASDAPEMNPSQSPIIWYATVIVVAVVAVVVALFYFKKQ
jgi:hypothetical protein